MASSSRGAALAAAVLLAAGALLGRPPSAWAGPRPSPARAGRAARHAAGAEALADERLRGAWRYSKGAYDILEEGGKLYFQELQLKGELQQEGEWLVATLAGAGTIRLKLNGEAGGEVLSNFKVPNSEEWGEDVVAVPEWGSLSAKAAALESQLDALEFTGAAADDLVVVTVDGRQRPKGVSLSPEAPGRAAELGPLVREAYALASEASLAASTEKLRELYAGHFGIQPEAAPA